MITANGTLENHPRLQTIWRDADLRIAADGGAVNARAHLHLAPHILIGDLDSIDLATRAWCEQAGAEIIQHPREKDETDLELAIDLAIARGATDLTILGALGDRFDHTIANALLLIKPMRAGVIARLAAADSETWVAAEHTTMAGIIGETISLIPLSDRVDGITTTGLRYPLRNESLYLGSPRGVSNELIAEQAEVTWTNGMLLIVHGLTHAT